MNILSLNIRGIGQDDRKDWIQKLCRQEKPQVLALQETKCGEIEDKVIENFWGSENFKYIQKHAVGFSGGMLLVWNTDVFNVNQAIEGEFFLTIKGHWKGIDEEIAFVNVYGPHNTAKKKLMWESLENLLNFKDMPWLLCGDFNEVRDLDERLNCDFNKPWSDMFNDFINKCCLIEIPLGGQKFTRISGDGLKFSKLDRFLISSKFHNIWPTLFANTLDRFTSDHCPIILRDRIIDFGPKPIRVFNAWLDDKGSVEVISNAWNLHVGGNRGDCILRNKLKNVKKHSTIGAKQTLVNSISRSKN
ncbi:uncharacterized protein [Rutidosis leptorrhynchoides]|uniref:uncharacterized protein n=1 Tax=Rutidosis leptorrhynchoides TaxID=125765 RepID=UPI003A998E7E